MACLVAPHKKMLVQKMLGSRVEEVLFFSFLTGITGWHICNNSSWRFNFLSSRRSIVNKTKPTKASWLMIALESKARNHMYNKSFPISFSSLPWTYHTFSSTLSNIYTNLWHFLWLSSSELTFPWQFRSNLNVGKYQNAYIPFILNEKPVGDPICHR